MRKLQSAFIRRAGFTLVEMIVVISIVVLLAAVTVPIALKFSDGRKARDAARTVQAVLSGARDRAMGNGYPVGVRFIQETNDPSIVRSLAYIRQPLPQTLGRAAVQKDGNGVYRNVRLLTRPSLEKLRTLRKNAAGRFVGDIRFEMSSKYYSFTAVDDATGIANNPPLLVLDEPLPHALPRDMTNAELISTAPATTSLGVEYRIPFASQPIEDSNPISLPDGVVIDLGTLDGDGNGAVDASSVRLSRLPIDAQSGYFDVLFSPGGQVMGTAASEPVLSVWIRDELAVVQETQVLTGLRQKRVKIPMQGAHVLVSVFGKTGLVKSADPVLADRFNETRVNITDPYAAAAGGDGFLDFKTSYDSVRSSAVSNF